MIDRVGVGALATAVLLLASAPAPADGHEPWQFSGDLGYGYDSNVSSSEAASDVRSSSVASAAVHAGYEHELSPYTTLLARGSLAGEHYDGYEALDNGKATGLLRLLYRADGDFFTPLLAVWGSASYWEFNSAMRDSNEYRGGAYLLEQVTTAISARLALAAVLRDSDSRVFDTRGASAALDLDWQLGPALTAYGGYQFYQGDVVSTAAPHDIKIGLAADVIEPDDAFGGLAADQRAYRLDGHTHLGTLGLNYGFSPKLSADLQGQFIDTRADYGNHYRRAVTVLSLLARF